MTYFIVGFITGLLATPHCAGMCGPFPLYLSRLTASGHPFIRQLLYILGKTFTYAFLGAVAGIFGEWLIQILFIGSHRMILGYILGGVMLAMGLVMLGVIPAFRISTASMETTSFITRIMSQFLHTPGASGSLLLGVFSGFLPCGVTIAGLAIAVSSHSAVWGMFTMLGLGLGTAPVLLAIGMSAVLLNARLRLIGLRFAGLLMLLVGIMTILRPTGILHTLIPSADKAKAYIQSSDLSLNQR
jgi:uncharacterized protein